MSTSLDIVQASKNLVFFKVSTYVKTVVLAAQNQTDFKKNWDDSSILGCTSWSKDFNWVLCMLHLYYQGTSVEPDKLGTP